MKRAQVMVMLRRAGRGLPVQPTPSDPGHFNSRTSGMRRVPMLKKVTLAALLLVLAPGLHAQNPTAKVSGTVTDASGAVIPGAIVTRTNHDTTVKTQSRTNESGIYVISFLSPGPYAFTAEAQG